MAPDESIGAGNECVHSSISSGIYQSILLSISKYIFVLKDDIIQALVKFFLRTTSIKNVYFFSISKYMLVLKDDIIQALVIFFTNNVNKKRILLEHVKSNVCYKR